MMPMRESAFYSRVHDHLPKSLHKQAMTGATFNGALDRYYDGPKSDLWVEYKSWPSMPRDGTICVKPIPNKKKQPRGRLSPLQLRWATRRWEHGKNAVVVVVLPNRMALVLTRPDHWTAPVDIALAMPVKEVAEWICGFCIG